MDGVKERRRRKRKRKRKELGARSRSDGINGINAMAHVCLVTCWRVKAGS